jgi:serine/threonine protein kinase
MDNRQPLEAGTVVGGDYRIVRVLGAGGFGITYLARDTRLGADVALKEYFPASLAYREDGATVQPIGSQAGDNYSWGLDRFLAEAQTVARLRHTNIVRVSRYFKENGTAYMVLGFVEGQDLESWLRDLGHPPTQGELDGIVGPVLDALKVVHNADVVHRDIKPQNIYIRAVDGAPIILDFGAARQALGEHTRATAAFVSPGYSPPESHLNDPAEQGPWTDIYSLAATLYRAVVGKPPAQVLSRVSHDTYVPLARQLSNAASYRANFLAAIDQGLRVRREERPESVTAWRSILFGNATDDTVVRTAQDRVSDDTVIAGRTRSGDKTKVVPPPRSQGKLESWAPYAGVAAACIVGFYYIYSSFGPAPAPQRPTVQEPAREAQQPAAPPAIQENAEAPRQPLTMPNSAPQPGENTGPTIATDPSLRRLAVASWYGAGIQGGYWTGVTTGFKGSGLYLKCRGDNGSRRQSIAELQFVPTGGTPLTGAHQVGVKVGTATDGAVLNFTSSGGFSFGQVELTETAANEGDFLNFLHVLFSGETLELSIPSIGYQENFNLVGAERALSPCFGANISQPWRRQPTVDGVEGGVIRNDRGNVFLVRCDTTRGTRGNTVVAFTARSGRVVQRGEQGKIHMTVGSESTDLDMVLSPNPGNIGGVLYHIVSDVESAQILRDFLAVLRNGSQMTLTNPDLSISEVFSLQGSSNALAGCSQL